MMRAVPSAVESSARTGLRTGGADDDHRDDEGELGDDPRVAEQPPRRAEAEGGPGEQREEAQRDAEEKAKVPRRSWAASTNDGSSDVARRMATARKPAESPSRPTDTTMCTVSTKLRARRPKRLARSAAAALVVMTVRGRPVRRPCPR